MNLDILDMKYDLETYVLRHKGSYSTLNAYDLLESMVNCQNSIPDDTFDMYICVLREIRQIRNSTADNGDSTNSNNDKYNMGRILRLVLDKSAKSVHVIELVQDVLNKDCWYSDELAFLSIPSENDVVLKQFYQDKHELLLKIIAWESVDKDLDIDPIYSTYLLKHILKLDVFLTLKSISATDEDRAENINDDYLIILKTISTGISKLISSIPDKNLKIEAIAVLAEIIQTKPDYKESISTELECLLQKESPETYRKYQILKDLTVDLTALDIAFNPVCETVQLPELV